MLQDDAFDSQKTDRDKALWLARHKVRMEHMYARALASGSERMANIFRFATEQIVLHDNPSPYEMLLLLNKIPVTIDEFVQSDEFLGDLMDVWPTLMPDLRLMNPDVFTGAEPVFEALLGGATGTGKTHLSQITQMYQLYLFTCFDSPQRVFNLAAKTPIVFMLLSVSPTITKRVIYQPLRETFVAMQYTQQNLIYDKFNESTLRLGNGLVVAPSAASLQSLVGQAIPSGILDEVNFMQIIEQSKQVPGPSGLGGKYDQAEVVYRNISRRRKRSFLTKGYSLGVLCVVSSTRYSGDFLDRRIDEVEQFNERNILCLRRKQYEVAPQERYSGEKFRYMIGSDTVAGRVIEDHEVEGVDYPDGAHIEEVPIELLTDFLRDPEAAQRDYMGIATNAITPLIQKRQKINDAVSRGRERALPQLVESDEVFLAQDGMPTFLPENFPTTRGWRNKSRWIHVDLSRVNDRCGIAMLCLDGFVNKAVEGADGLTESLPRFAVELAVGIKPSVVSPINITEVRAWVLQLARDYELNIEGISFDGFDSRETIQVLRNSGMNADTVSMDRSPTAYMDLRDALYDDRLDIQPDVSLLLTELRTIEYYAKKNRVDHPPNGSKDVSDCVAGALSMAMKSRIVRNGIEIVTDDEAGAGHVQPPRFRVRRDRTRIFRERRRPE